jgi:hypothetical protein
MAGCHDDKGSGAPRGRPWSTAPRENGNRHSVFGTRLAPNCALIKYEPIFHKTLSTSCCMSRYSTRRCQPYAVRAGPQWPLFGFCATSVTVSFVWPAIQVRPYDRQRPESEPSFAWLCSDTPRTAPVRRLNCRRDGCNSWKARHVNGTQYCRFYSNPCFGYGVCLRCSASTSRLKTML